MAIHNEMTEVNPIDEKIELLHDFCLLRQGATKQEAEVRKILGTCASELQMEQKLYNVLHGKETLKDFIYRHRVPSLRQV